MATALASVSKSSAGTTRDTRPLRSASAASMVRPVRIRSMALALPIARVSRCEPPMPGSTPSLISGWPNFAVSAAISRSHIIASSQPPPSACPATAAIVGVRTAASLAQGAKKSSSKTSENARLRHFFDVGARGERFRRPGDDDRSDAAIVVEFGCRGGDFAHDLAVERVERFRPVQRDDADPLVALDQDGFVRIRRCRHCGCLSRTSDRRRQVRNMGQRRPRSRRPAMPATTSDCGPYRPAARGCPPPGRVSAATRTTPDSPGSERLPACQAWRRGALPPASPTARRESGWRSGWRRRGRPRRHGRAVRRRCRQRCHRRSTGRSNHVERQGHWVAVRLRGRRLPARRRRRRWPG